MALTGVLPVGVCLGVFAALLPWAFLRWQVRRRRRQLAEVWPDVVDHLRSAVRSGLALPEGLAELGSTGPEPLRGPFLEFGADWRAGVPMGPALERLKIRLADPVGDRIVLALRTTRELGGTDLGRLLDSMADVLRENARTRSELEARQSWTVNGAKLAVAAPWIVVLLLSLRPEAAEAYHSMTGMLVLSSGLVVSLICYHVMLRIGALPAEERVLI
ncbi:type II secretion system F family protein [Nesterenkonia sphaerica]